MLKLTIVAFFPVVAGCSCGGPVECQGRARLLNFNIDSETGDDPRTITQVIEPESGVHRVDVEAEVPPSDEPEFVAFRQSDDARFVDVPVGAARLFGGSGSCFGEGCDFTLFGLHTDGLGTFLIFGQLNVLDDGDRSFQEVPGATVRLARDPPQAACPDGDGEVPAGVTVTTDDGPLTLLPGEHAPANIDGVTWQVEAGTSRREEWFTSPAPCADCAGPGWHANTTIDVVLYRAQEE